MRLTDLEPWFFRRVVENGRETLVPVATLAEAQGVFFTCPKCQEHSLCVFFRDRGVPDDAQPGPGRWAPSGTGLHDLTLSPSIDLSRGGGGCGWHGFVHNGEAR